MMNELTPAIWTTGTTEVFKTGTWRNALPAYVEAPSPCHLACPVGGDIAVWIQQLKVEDYRGAWVTLTENNPFPAVAGRICHRPCERDCNRGGYDEAIAICGLERFVGDMALEQGWSFPGVPITKEEQVAIVGGGPSGLAAAFHLRRMGYAVTVFEMQPRLGGLMRYGIPPYRLSHEVLDREIQRIVDLGVTVKTDSCPASRSEFEALEAEFDAVYLATGARNPKVLPQLDYGRPWVVEGADFLARTNSGETPAVGQRVVVIGGGSAALDAARTARRHGRAVRVLCLEAEEQMPAQREEVVEAREEGVEFITGAMLQSVSDRGEPGLDLRCVKVTFEPGAERGEFRVEPVAGSEFTIQADTVIPSIGQDPDLSGLEGMVDVGGRLVEVDRGQRTSRDGFFAGGDVTSLERFVTHALGLGKSAAHGIDRYLHPETARAESRAGPEAPLDAVNTYYYPARPRRNQQTVPAAERMRGFAEVQLDFMPSEAAAESERCFSCGHCIYCDNCFYYCPDMAVRREENGYSINADYCKGCGLCVSECPTGAIIMRDEMQ